MKLKLNRNLLYKIIIILGWTLSLIICFYILRSGIIDTIQAVNIGNNKKFTFGLLKIIFFECGTIFIFPFYYLAYILIKDNK